MDSNGSSSVLTSFAIHEDVNLKKAKVPHVESSTEQFGDSLGSTVKVQNRFKKRTPIIIIAILASTFGV